MSDSTPSEPRSGLWTRCISFLTPRPLKAESKFVTYWTIWMRINYLFCTIMFPLLMAWSEHFQYPAWLCISATCDLFSFINIYISSHKIQEDNYGKPITDLRILRRHYFIKNKGYFVFFLSIPWELLVFCSSNLVVRLATGREYDTE